MDMQNVSNLQIPEGGVRTIHDKDSRLLWGRTAYSVKYAGGTSQQSYSGRNLVYANYEQKSAQGVTWKYDKESGEFTVNGTPDQTYSVPSGVSLFSTPIPAGTYTLVIDNLVQGAIVGIALKQSDGTGRTVFPMARTNKSVTFSIPSAYPAFDIYLTGLTVGQSISGKFKAMFVSGSSAAVDFEPYVGGIPAPNPDYPQEVQTVTGEQTVEVTGKNLIYTNPRTNEGITFSYNSTNGVTAISGTPTLTYAISATNSVSIPAGTYTISIDSPKPFNIGIGTRNASNVRIPTYIPAGDTSVTITRTEPVVGYDIYVSGLTSGTYISGEFKLMLEQGSTATAYEPYHLQSYEINLGKNIWSSSMEVGGISANGTNLSNDKRVRSTTKVVVRPGTTYTLSATPRDSGKVINVAVQGWASDGTFISQITGAAWQTLPLTFTTPANCYNITLNGRYSDDAVFGTVGDPTDAFQNIQLEVGANASEYAPYFTPIELCKIGDYQDYIYKSGDDWYAHKAIKKVILDGSEAWNMFSGRNGTFYITKRDIMLASSTAATPNVISNYYEPKPFDSLYKMTVDYGIANHNAQYWIAIRNKDYSDVSSFKTWLASNNTTVYYVLATPTDTQITDATLVGQLNAVHQWLTRYGYNATVTGNLPIIVNRTNL